MEEKKLTVYCGSGKLQSQSWIKATINVDKIQDFIEEFKGTRFVRLNINVKDAPDQFGKDVSLSIDQFVPDQSKGSGESDGKRYGLSGEQAQASIDDAISSELEEEDDLPF
jgi:hypothetical protein